MELMDFYNCLFDPEDWICSSKSPKGTEVFLLDYIELEDAFVCINPLDKIDRNPTESYHKEYIPRRADHNVTKFRNILVEMDKVPLEKQDQHMSEIGFPYSTCTFSGNKSFHWIISLQKPVSTRNEYNRLVTRVYKAVGQDLVDQTCRNPSRFTRVPGHLRDNGNIQKLFSVRGRIPNEMLESWLVFRGAPQENEEKNQWEDITYKSTKPKDISNLFPSTRNFLMWGTSENWNHTLFKAAADLCRNGWDIEEAHEMLEKITGHLDGTDERTIKSAYSNEENNYGKKD